MNCSLRIDSKIFTKFASCVCPQNRFATFPSRTAWWLPVLMLALVNAVPAATVNLTASDANGASTSFNSAANWSDGQAPSAGNDYLTAGWLARTPTSSTGNSNTFAGNSLSLDYNSSNPLAGLAMKYSTPPGAILVNNLKLNGGAIFNGGGGTMSVHGNLTVLASSFFDPQASSRTLAIYAPISGSGAVSLNVREWSGTTTANAGGIVQLLGDNSNYGGTWTIWGGTNGAVLQVGNGGTSGNLGSGNVTNNYSLQFKRSDSLAVANAISGTGSLVVAGPGTLALSGYDSYSGPTTASAGTMLVNGTLAATSYVSILAGATLGGFGTINSPVTVSGTLAPGGAGLGTLTINHTLTLTAAGTSVLRLQKTAGTLTNDLLKGMTGVTYNGTLTITATGDPLAVNDKFVLFSNASGARSGSFSTLNLPVLSTGLSWDTSGLTVDGSIKIINRTATPTFTPPAGTYFGPQSVTISSEPGAMIFYTTDGSSPASSATRLSGLSPITGIPVPANTNLTIQAYATNSSSPDSLLAGATYNITQPKPQILKVYLQGGQSNSDGRAKTNGLPASLLRSQNDVPLYYYLVGTPANSDGTYGHLSTVQTGVSAQGTGTLFGPELTFGRALADYYSISNGVSTNTVMVAIIKYADGGTSLGVNWAANGTSSPTGDGPDYVIFQKVVSAGLSNLAAAYPGTVIELDGMIWVQGETDIDNGVAAATAYGTNLIRFVNDVRLTFAGRQPYGTNLPFFYSRISANQTTYSLPTDASYANYLLLRAGQAFAAASLPNMHLLNIDGPQFTTLTPNSGPGLHFDTAGQQAIGAAFAQAVRNALPPPQLDLAPQLDNGWQITLSGVTGATHTLQQAPAVVGPWTDLTTFILGPLGITNYQNQGSSPAAGFYRAWRP